MSQIAAADSDNIDTHCWLNEWISWNIDSGDLRVWVYDLIPVIVSRLRMNIVTDLSSCVDN